MKALYRLHVQHSILVSAFLFFTIFTAWSQKGPAVHEGLMRIKVSEALAVTLERSAMARTAEGVVITGVSSLDDFNRRFKVTQFRRLFRGAGKFEARHRKHGLHRWYEIRVESPIPVLQAVSAYQSLIQVEKAEPVHKKAIVGSDQKNFGPVVVAETLSSVAALNGPSNDPMLAGQWHYNNTGQTGGTPGADIRLFDAWQSQTGKREVIVAVNDGGIQLDHPDLMANLWVNSGEVAGNNIDDDRNGFIDDVHGYSFVDDTGDIVEDDHGTHVAGTIAAVTHNGKGVAGVAGGSGSGDGVRLMSCAVFGYFVADGFPEAFVYAADNGAVVSQNSWGYISPGAYELAVLEAIDYFIAEAGQDETGAQTGPMKGGLVVFSAGNSNADDKHYPGYYASTFAVAGTTHRNGKAWYSNYGSWVDISAPGGETEYVAAEGVLSTLSGGQYGLFQGTSMACPHVSGTAALVISKYGKPGFSPEAVRERLRSTAASLDTGNPAYNGKMGSGLLNAAAALRDNDHTAPAAITDLSIVASDIGTETLSWTVPADQGSFVASYDIRYSKTPITAANFNSATASDPPAAKPSGNKQEFTVTGLSGGTLYYFAVKAIDFEGNRSPISNIISKTTVQAPVIEIAPSSLTVDLQTAQSATRTLTVRNTGPGPLRFNLGNAVVENDFAACSPDHGDLAPGNNQVITVTFDAANLLAGTYRKDLRVESNDPERSLLIVPLVLRVTNNNAPIASVGPDSIHFKSVQVGTSIARKITVHNAGSNPLVISGAETGSEEFTTDFSGSISIPAFHDTTMTITFSPASPGLKHETITLYTNDEAHPTLVVVVAGEGLNEAPVAVMPAAIEETIERGTTSQRTLTLTNNGSFDRTFRIEVMGKGLQPATVVKEKGFVEPPANARVKSSEQNYQARPAPDPAKVDALLLAQQGPVRTNARTDAARQRDDVSQSAFHLIEQYATGFENFETGSVNNQEGWYSSEGWTIETIGPDRGAKHLRGTAVVPGQTTLAISPTLAPDDIPEESPQFTTVSMRVNFDNMEGATWQIVPQDHWSYVVTRIRINEDRTIDVMSNDENYETLWNRIDAELPTGYFDLAVEHNGHGDGTTGFPTFDLYLNNIKVFTGYNIGPLINEVAFICTAGSAGPALDVDDLDLHIGEHVPGHITPEPFLGNLAAGSTTEIALGIDATNMRFGSYQSDVIVHVDETSKVVVPTLVTVAGEGSLAASTSQLNGTGYRDELIAMDLSIQNTGGVPFHYELAFNLPGLSATPSTEFIPVRDSEHIVLEYDPSVSGPGIFYDTLNVITDLVGDVTLRVPIFIRVWEEFSIFSAPAQVHMQVRQGEVITQTFQISNTGQNSLQFENYMYDTDAIMIEPQRGAIAAGEQQDIIVTLDGTQLVEGWGRRSGYFMTNDPAHGFHYFTIQFDVLPATANGSGTITREEWAGVTGKTVASIPVNTPPVSVTSMTSLEGTYGYGDNYGVRIRGYIQAPQTGDYTFWIASDDHSELWLSTDTDPANKQKIAYLNNYVDRGQYEKYPSQRSFLISLEAGTKYYIEVLHKEGTGRDHLTVGWELPGGQQEFPIPGVRLFPLNFTTPENRKPVVTIISPQAGADLAAPASVEIAAEISDQDGDVVKVEFYNGSLKLGADASAPYSFRWNNVAVGNYEIVVKATDNLGAESSASVSIVVKAPSCDGTGTIRREVWTGVAGVSVSAIPVNDPPSSVNELSMFEAPINAGDSYGSRIRGYLCVPATGTYIFWIASDDQSELWLSTDESPSNKIRIASVTGHTQRRQWEKYPTQKSAAVTLQAGRKYYIEALHKEGTGTDHLAVGWQLPDGVLERPVPGNRLIPFEEIVTPACAGTGTMYWDFWPSISGTSVSLIPVNTSPAMVTEITSFETPEYYANNYGARLRGYVCVPQTGTYTFWIASDDNSELWLSTDTDDTNKMKIASVAGSTRPRQWEKYPSQRSVAIALVAGYRYYIEALHKEANGNDHVAVAWQLPDGTFEGPIPGNRLSPSLDGMAQARSGNSNALFATTSGAGETISEIDLYPNPAQGGFVTLSFPANADQAPAGTWQIEITSMTGTVVHSQMTSCTTGCGDITIGLNEKFTPGIYMVNVIVNRKRFSKKLLIH